MSISRDAEWINNGSILSLGGCNSIEVLYLPNMISSKECISWHGNGYWLGTYNSLKTIYCPDLKTIENGGRGAFIGAVINSVENILLPNLTKCNMYLFGGGCQNIKRIDLSSINSITGIIHPTYPSYKTFNKLFELKYCVDIRL